MTKGSDNPYPSTLFVEQGSTPSTPSSGNQRLFIRTSDHLLCYVNSSGTVSTVDTGFANPLTTTGDIIYSSSGTTAARRAIGSTGDVLTVSGGVPTWAAPAAGSLTGYMNQLSSDVTMTSANTYYDGPSHSLTSGTWVIIASVTFGWNGNAQETIKIWDGTTVGASIQAANGDSNHALSCACLVVLGGTATWKVSGCSTVAGELMKAATPNNSAGNTATTLVCFKIA